MITIDNLSLLVLLDPGFLFTDIQLNLDETVVLEATADSWSDNIGFFGATDFVRAAAVWLNLAGAFEKRNIKA